MDIFLGVLFIIICILLIIVVLLQKGRGGGLGAAFGGAGSSAFGTKTGDVFTWVTIVLTAAFLVLAVGTVLAFKQGKDEVPPPTFAPDSMAITEPMLVQLKGAKTAKIFYTLDKSDPNQDSKMFTEPIEVKPGTTIKAATFRAGRFSKVVTAFYPNPKEQESQPASTSGPASSSAPATKATSASAPAAASAPTSVPVPAASAP